jgi:hypothetical protein
MGHLPCKPQNAMHDCIATYAHSHHVHASILFDEFCIPTMHPTQGLDFPKPNSDNSIAAIYRKKSVWYACVSFLLRKI